MKKNRIITLTMSFVVSLTLCAQGVNESAEKRCEVFSGIETGGIYSGKFSEYSDVSLGVRVNRLSVKGTAEWLSMKTDGKHYNSGIAVGGALSYRLFKFKDCGFPVNGSVATGFTHSVGKSDWAFSKYNVGLTLKQHTRTWLDGSFSFGYTYIKSHSAHMHDFSGVYAGLGIGL